MKLVDINNVDSEHYYIIYSTYAHTAHIPSGKALYILRIKEVPSSRDLVHKVCYYARWPWPISESYEGIFRKTGGGDSVYELNEDEVMKTVLMETI